MEEKHEPDNLVSCRVLCVICRNFGNDNLMTPNQFNTALHKLGLSQMEASRMLGIDDRTVRRYAAGDARVPVTLAKLLQLAIAGKITVIDISKAGD